MKLKPLKMLNRLRTKWSNDLLATENHNKFSLAKWLHTNHRLVTHCSRIAAEISALPSGTELVALWDYHSSNCKFGDYIFALTAAKVAAHHDIRVTFAETLNKTGGHYRADVLHDHTYENFLSQRVSLRGMFGSTNINYWEGSFAQLQKLPAYQSGYVMFAKQARTRKYMIDRYHNVISPLYSTLNDEQEELFRQSLDQPAANSKYCFATNYRINTARPSKNSDADQFKTFVERLNPQEKFYVCTDATGEAELRKNFAGQIWFEKAVIEGAADYLHDYQQVHEAPVFFQYHGGGMAAAIVAASSIPYVVYQKCGHLVPITFSQLFSHSNNQQLSISSLDFERYSERAFSMFYKKRAKTALPD